MASPSDAARALHLDSLAELTDTERAVLGDVSTGRALASFDRYTADRLGQPIRAIIFRAGRIDAVWGVELDDGREVVIKTHRLPVDLRAVNSARAAMALLRRDGFPCPAPLSGPDEVGGRVLTIDTLVRGEAIPDARLAAVRRLLAVGLARHIGVLRQDPGLREPAGAGPSWCRYQWGPWPVPHDPIVDFRSCPQGYAWLDAYARRASGQLLTHRHGQEVVVGHADWYAGNVVVAHGELAGSYDWELVADTEAVIAGFSAAGFASSSTSGEGLSTPEEVVAFLQDYEVARGLPFSVSEQKAAAAAAGWIVAFNARWEVALRGDRGEGATTALLRDRRADYLTLSW